MTKNFLWYIGFAIVVIASVILLDNYGFRAWIVGIVLSIGSMLEAYGCINE